MSPRCTAIVPFRADEAGERSANLAAVLGWLATMPLDVVLVEHGPSPTPDIADTTTLGSVRSIHVGSDGPFSKAAACNAGYAVASTPVIALVDADMLVARRAVLGCIARVDGGLDVIRPFGQLVDLDRAATRQVRDGTAPWDMGEVADVSERQGEVVPICGGLVILRADAYERAGGMDEAFAGWGGEDDALSTALVRTGSDCRILRAERGYHLWHPRESAQRNRHARYGTNVRRARWWSDASDDEIAAASAAGRRRLRAAQE